MGFRRDSLQESRDIRRGPRLSRRARDSRRRSDVSRGRPDETTDAALLIDVRTPPHDPGRGKRRGEERSWNADRVQQDGSIELHIGAQTPLRMPLGEQALGFAFDRSCQREALTIGIGALQHRHRTLQGSCPRIPDSIDAVAHSHDASPSGELRLEPGLSTPWMTDRVEHVEHRSWRATVQWSLQGADRGHNRTDEI